MFGTLFIVATPIGNLQDITLRAINILKKVNYIACEDTRKTGTLLKSLGIENHHMLVSYYEQVEMARIPNILNILKNGQDLALISDSGTPGISDPGFRLVRLALEEGINVISIPGPSAVVSALVSSGLPTDKFIFLGFLPKKEGKRLKLLRNLKEANSNLEATAVIYEAPHKLVKTLKSLQEVFGNLEITLMRELTKIHEERINDNVENLKKKYETEAVRGEFVILFSPKIL
ncbi:MAG: 16S rRNA (cytidine(1402)-2'-O)-methyltransferase [Candidatus Levybacteria bacterium]|nr:16S rRNA (cytidine(1402)-2'-O)-methyltransferase [Candidatus Levybacteria bacterium]